MAKYKVIKKFADLLDGKHVYEIGDVFPRDGVDVSRERLEELSSDNNKIGEPLIKEDVSKPRRAKEDVEADASPSEAPKAKGKPRKKREEV